MVRRKDLANHLDGSLAAYGFRKRAGSVFTVELAEGILDHATLERITQQIESRRGERSTESYRVPVAYLLAGKQSQTIGVLDRDIDFVGDRYDTDG